MALLPRTVNAPAKWAIGASRTRLAARLRDLIPLVMALAAFGPQIGEPLSVHGDNILHLFRLVALDHNVALGALYPRWLPELFLGYGYPLLDFYAASTYYVALALHALGLDYANALIFTMLGLVLLGSLGIYRLACDIFGDLLGDAAGDAWLPALVATAAYVFSPYLLYNWYIRGAIAELGAQALLPWIFWSYRRLLTAASPSTYLLGAALSLGALAATHTVSLLLVPPALVAYVLVRQASAQERRLGWFLAATLLAAGVSAFVWLPAAVERRYLADQAYTAAATYIRQHMWTWQTVLDRGWLFDYTNAAPPRLGQVQVLLLALGLLLPRRRTADWWFMAALAAVALALIASVAAPLWTQVRPLLAVQFPWRLLGVAGLPLALLTGGVMLLPWPRRPRTLLTAAVMAIIVFANYPRMPWLQRLQLAPEQINLTSITQYEAITRRFGLSAALSREFMPRWVERLEPGALAAGEAETPPRAIVLRQATPYALEMEVTADRPARLRFSTFYFPGWQARVNNAAAQVTPTTDFGLLTVDVPAGRTSLRVAWEGTLVQRAAAWTSLATLAGLALFYRRRLRLALWPAAVLAIVLAIVSVAWFASRLPRADFHVAGHASGEGLDLLGYTTVQRSADHLYLFPVWYVAQRPDNWQMRWELHDASGALVTATTAYPYFNALRTFDWLPGMVVDDAVYLPLPPGTPAGDYRLDLALVEAETATPRDATPVGQVRVARSREPLPAPAYPQRVVFADPMSDNRLTLEGYDLAVAASSETDGATTVGGYRIVAAGDTLLFTLAWRAQQAVRDGTQLSVQLLDHAQRVAAHVDAPLALSPGAPYFLWDPYAAKPFTLRLPIAPETRSGIYRPYLVLYDADSQAQFPIVETSAAAPDAASFLTPIKVINPTAPALSHPLDIRLGDTSALVGYDLATPVTGVRPGSVLTVTLQYQSLAPTPVDYTQFVHLVSETAGMAAQFDTPPQGGGNPTSAWVPGEIVTDAIALTIDAAARPGSYALWVGLYDPATQARLPVIDATGQRQANDQLLLTTVAVE
jgi:hypothetical protein